MQTVCSRWDYVHNKDDHVCVCVGGGVIVGVTLGGVRVCWSRDLG